MNFRNLDLPDWTPIAIQSRDTQAWTDIDDAPISRAEAMVMECAGRLLVASRYDPTARILCIRSLPRGWVCRAAARKRQEAAHAG
jgi:hypothetical protein